MTVDTQKQKISKVENSPNKITMLIYNWAASNIFLFKRWDGFLYLFLYIIVPVVLSCVGLFTSLNDTAFANCYLSIIINALNCLYDVFGRWDDNMPVKKAKLSFILFSCVIILVYSFIRLVAILCGHVMLFKHDVIFCLYAPAVFVALLDIFALSCRNKALIAMIKD